MEDCKGGFPHSEITGSKGASASPVLIAACHVLHRLSTPRHPSEALQRLIVSQQNSCRDDPADWKEMPAGPCLIFVRQCLLSNRSSKPMRGRTNSSFTISMPSNPEVGGNFCTILRVPGGARRSRTDDILLAKQALYQLSYGPVPVNSAKPRRAVGACHAASPAELVGPGRLELPTSRLSGVRSNQAELRAYGRTTA